MVWWQHIMARCKNIITSGLFKAISGRNSTIGLRNAVLRSHESRRAPNLSLRTEQNSKLSKSYTRPNGIDNNTFKAVFGFVLVYLDRWPPDPKVDHFVPLARGHRPPNWCQNRLIHSLSKYHVHKLSLIKDGTNDGQVENMEFSNVYVFHDSESPTTSRCRV